MTSSDEIVELRELNHADRNASVKLVSIGGQKYVLKTDSEREIASQKFFNHELTAAGMPALEAHTHAQLQDNQILLEYVEDSLTLGKEPTIERSRAWGDTVARVHTITKPHFELLSDACHRSQANWHEYLEAYIKQAVKWQRSRPYQLGDETIVRAEQIVRRLLDYEPSTFAVSHGDLHVNNVLVKQDGQHDTLILFDKSSDFLTAPAAYDLGTLYAEAFAGGAYPELGFSTQAQQDMMAAFIEGYNATNPLPDEQVKWLDYFVLLRAFYRWPNRFAPHSGEVVRLLVEKLR